MIRKGGGKGAVGNRMAVSGGHLGGYLAHPLFDSQHGLGSVASVFYRVTRTTFRDQDYELRRAFQSGHQVPKPLSVIDVPEDLASDVTPGEGRLPASQVVDNNLRALLDFPRVTLADLLQLAEPFRLLAAPSSRPPRARDGWLAQV